MLTPAHRLYAEARPFAEALFAASPCRDNYAGGDAEHEIRLNQGFFVADAILTGRTIAEVAAAHLPAETIAHPLVFVEDV